MTHFSHNALQSLSLECRRRGTPARDPLLSATDFSVPVSLLRGIFVLSLMQHSLLSHEILILASWAASRSSTSTPRFYWSSPSRSARRNGYGKLGMSTMPQVSCSSLDTAHQLSLCRAKPRNDQFYRTREPLSTRNCHRFLIPTMHLSLRICPTSCTLLQSSPSYDSRK